MYANVLCANLSQIPGFNEMNINDENISNILKLNKVECKTSENTKYKVIRYDKNILSADLVSTYGLCRSIIVNSDNKVVSFSPPKSIPADSFIRLNPDKTENIIVEEFVEGTMINVFWDKKIGLAGGWEIATRNTVGATSSFYKSTHTKTFRTMFLDAASENNISLEKLNPQYCYSFVLQHPENRIVAPFTNAQLYLVGMYFIDNSEINNIRVYMVDMIEARKFNWFDANIKFPQFYEWNTYSDLIEKYASMNTSYNIMGVVIYNRITGYRTKIRNPVYEEVRNLRGNQPKLQYQYLSLRKEGKVSDFLKFYPENKKDFSTFRDQLHLFTNTLFANYVSCYIKKEKPLLEFSDQYRTHMFTLHKKYMTELREKKWFITNKVVINYVNELPTSLLMYCLNYQFRKRNVDFLKAETSI